MGEQTKEDSVGMGLAMSTLLSVHNLTDRRSVNAEPSPEYGITSLFIGIRSADHVNVIIGEFSVGDLPTLAIPIVCIVGVCAGEDVRWIDTGRVVTPMQAKWLVIGERAVGQHPCNAMRLHVPDTHFENTITTEVPTGLPFPALVGAASIDLRPEPLDVFWGKLGMHRRDSSCVAVAGGDASRRSAFLQEKV